MLCYIMTRVNIYIEFRDCALITPLSMTMPCETETQNSISFQVQSGNGV